MVFNKCMGCDNLVPQTESKKAKLYCSSTCRQKVWQDKRREELRIFRKMSKSTALVAQVKEAAEYRKSPLVNAARGRDANGINQDEALLSEKEATNEEIYEQIKAIRAEKIPTERDTSGGRKSWNFDQNKRIQQLKSKLT